MQITNKAPTAAAFASLVPTVKTQAIAKHIINSEPLFVCAYDDEQLCGVTWAVGDGMSWLVPRIYVHEDYRGQGIGRTIRVALISRCEEATKGHGYIYGFYADSGFWDAVPGTDSLKSYTGVRPIRGSA